MVLMSLMQLITVDESKNVLYLYIKHLKCIIMQNKRVLCYNNNINKTKNYNYKKAVIMY